MLLRQKRVGKERRAHRLGHQKAHAGKKAQKKKNFRSVLLLLVTGDRGIPQIASLPRFCDRSHCTPVFCRQTGQTPGEHRKENRK